jgi:hypothetical protein
VTVDPELDRLYGLPLDEFTSGRDSLARELRKADDREAADHVKALRKPSISAWTVNQLARTERLQVRSLLTAGESLRAAQEALLGGGDPSTLQAAFERQRETVGALVESAKKVLRAAGHPVTEATLDRVRGTLTSAAGDEEAAGLVESGRLTEDLDPAGFGPLARGGGARLKPRARPKSATAARKRAPVPAKGQRPDEVARKRRIEEAKHEVDGLRAELAERKAQARRAETQARKAERAAEAAKDAAGKAEAELEEVAARLEAAKEALDQARSR